VAISVFLAQTRAAAAFAWLGAHSIVIYLAFFLPMAVSRTILLKTGIIPDLGTVALLVTLAGILGPIVLYALIQWTGYGKFLFERPDWARIDGPYRRPKEALVSIGPGKAELRAAPLQREHLSIRHPEPLSKALCYIPPS